MDVASATLEVLHALGAAATSLVDASHGSTNVDASDVAGAGGIVGGPDGLNGYRGSDVREVLLEAAAGALGDVFELIGADKTDMDARTVAVELLRGDFLVLLLLLMQRSVSRVAADGFRPTGSRAALMLSDACVLALAQLREVGKRLPLPVKAESEPWEHEALRSLELLDPFLAAGELVWPIFVRHHEPGCSVLDAVETCADGSMERMRHLVLGVWKGVNEFRETEVNLCQVSGVTLENFYTCTLAGVAAFHLDDCTRAIKRKGMVRSKANEPRVLMIGLGGGSVPAFIQRYFGGARVDAVEISEQAARMAERFFGLRCEPSLLREESTDPPGFVKPLPNVNMLDDDRGKSLANARMNRHKRKRNRQTNSKATVAATETLSCRVIVADAAEFVHEATNIMAYDFVVVDVYTAGKFPPLLLAPHTRFFEGVRSVLKPGGACAVNAGYGEDEARVLALANAAFGVENVDTLVDENAVQESDRSHENAVLHLRKPDVKNEAPEPQRLSVETWANHMEQPSSNDGLSFVAPKLPFLLDQCCPTAADTPHELHVFWKASTAKLKAPELEQVTFASKDDTVWDLF